VPEHYSAINVNIYQKEGFTKEFFVQKRRKMCNNEYFCKYLSQENI